MHVANYHRLASIHSVAGFLLAAASVARWVARSLNCAIEGVRASLVARWVAR